jgi:hypothetical protein
LLCDSATNPINLYHSSTSVQTGSTDSEILTTSNVARVGTDIIDGWN